MPSITVTLPPEHFDALMQAAKRVQQVAAKAGQDELARRLSEARTLMQAGQSIALAQQVLETV